MRITREQIKQIIKEELEAVMQEQEGTNGYIFYKMGPKALEAAKEMIEDAAEREEDYEFSKMGDLGIELDVPNAQLADKILAALGEQLVQEDPDTRFDFRRFGERAEY